MKYTSSEANKLLKKLNSDYQRLLAIEAECSTFLAATGEDPESVRPEYDYAKTREELAVLAAKIRTVKHALNVFNTTTVPEGFDVTIDEMLVMLPQLTDRVNTLNQMRSAIPKKRERTFGSGISATIDYRYTNYDIDEAARDYEEAYALLVSAQTALDTANNTIGIEIDV